MSVRLAAYVLGKYVVSFVGNFVFGAVHFLRLKVEQCLLTWHVFQLNFIPFLSYEYFKCDVMMLSRDLTPFNAYFTHDLRDEFL
jgi:hypothetical protein